MRSLFLLVLCAGFAVGCTNTRYDRYDRSSRSYPASARVDSRGGQDRYVICHKGKNTRTLPAPAVRAHLNHGDRFGSCSRRDRDRYEDRGRRDNRNERRGNRGRGNQGRGNGRN